MDKTIEECERYYKNALREKESEYGRGLCDAYESTLPTLRRLQARSEAAERQRDEAERLHSDAVKWVGELKARIAELEMPVTDEEVLSLERSAKEARDIGFGGQMDRLAQLNAALDIIRRLSRQSKSNALLGKCEEALRAIARQQYSTEMEDSEDGCFVDAYDDLIVIARAALSQIEQSKELEVKETR